MVDYADIAAPDGQTTNMGGIKQRIFVAPISYFDTIAKPVTSPVNPEDFVNVDGDHTFLPNKGFHKFYVTLDKGGIDFETQGERDGRSYKQMLKAFTPGSDERTAGVMSMLKNERCIVLVEESDGVVDQLGSEDYYAELLPKYSTGETTAGLRGWSMEITSVGPVNLRYPGTITLYADEQGS